jgi:hypothetical protein
MDWRFVDDEKWRDIYVAMNGAGVESVQAQWEDVFGEEVKVKKPRKKTPKKAVAKKNYF